MCLKLAFICGAWSLALLIASNLMAWYVSQYLVLLASLFSFYSLLIELYFLLNYICVLTRYAVAIGEADFFTLLQGSHKANVSVALMDWTQLRVYRLSAATNFNLGATVLFQTDSEVYFNLFLPENLFSIFT